MATPSATEIDPSTTRERLAAGAILVDVREADELAQAAYDVPGVIHLPLSEITDRFEELPKDRALVIACRSGGRSLRATQILLDQGYANVVSLRGGILEWSALGFPVRGTLPAD